MNKIKRILDYYFNLITLGLLIFLITGIIVLIFNDFKVPDKEPTKNNNIDLEVAQDVPTETKKIKVDIKGAIKKPGVYELDSSNNVFDLITLAGGLSKNADTSNINLSRVLEDQMVIKIYTKSEIKKTKAKEIVECVCPEVTITKCEEKEASITKIEGEEKNTNDTNYVTNDTNYTISEETKTSTQTNNELVSINTATKEQLMTLNSIGEAKANAIIEYRNTNGNFKNIEEIKNVTGIGDSLFEKIKSYITI